jgi:hypothetical protein
MTPGPSPRAATLSTRQTGSVGAKARTQPASSSRHALRAVNSKFDRKI